MRFASWLCAAAIVLASPVAFMQGQGGAQGRGAGGATPARTAPAGPVVVFETVKGPFEIEFYPKDAPRSVEHILALVKRNFYNGLRVHRVDPGFVIQFGDPQTRDMTKRAQWGTGGSGRAVGVAEISPNRRHRVGAVALAHSGDPTRADSQLYIALATQERYPHLEGKYTIVGQVVAGMDVVHKLQITDVIRRATVKDAAQAPR